MNWITDELDRKIMQNCPKKSDIVDTKTGARKCEAFKTAVTVLFHKDSIFASKK